MHLHFTSLIREVIKKKLWKSWPLGLTPLPPSPEAVTNWHVVIFGLAWNTSSSKCMDTLSNAEKSQNLLEAKRLGDGRLDRNRKRNMLLFSTWWTHNLSISWQSCCTQKSNFKLSLIVVDQECPGCPLSALITNPSSLPPPSLLSLTGHKHALITNVLVAPKAFLSSHQFSHH